MVICNDYEFELMRQKTGFSEADVLAKAPTGSGKTFAFGLPIVELADPAAPTPTALVLVPTRELASQVAEELYFVAKPKRLNRSSAQTAAPIATAAAPR